MTPLDIECDDLDSVNMVAEYSLPCSCTKSELVRMVAYRADDENEC